MTTTSHRTLDRRALLGGTLGALGVGALPGLAGCSARSGGRSSGPPTGRVLTVDASRSHGSLADAPDLEQVVGGMAAFAGRLHSVTATTKDSWTVSPLSVAVAFGMLRAGARGRTATELDDVLGFPAGRTPEGAVHPTLNALVSALVTTDPVTRDPAAAPSGGAPPPPVVAVANALFVADGFGSSVRPDFLTLLARQYWAQVLGVDFTSASATATINRWVSQQTRGRITRLFDQLDSSTLLVLANAVYLKTTWQQQFDPGSTALARFTTASGTSSDVHLMNRTLDGVRYDETPRWQRVVLPYAGGGLTMRVVLPRGVARDVLALGDLLPVATGRAPSGTDGWVDLSLPRWDTATTIDLVTPLSLLGMPDAFRATADLGGIAPGLRVSDAVHRATVTVDEAGTEAAAVTGISMATSARIGSPVAMRVDRPFVWAVVHEPSGCPVFTGHVVDPAR